MSRSANNFRAKSFRFLLWSCLTAALQLTALAAQSVTLAWHPSTIPNVANYRIYYGTVSQNYSSVVTVGNVTNTTIPGLAAGTTYYFAATTQNAAGVESAFSNEATFSTAAAVVVNQPPTLNSLANLTVNQNAGAQSLALTGISSGSPTQNQVLKVTVTSSNANLTGKLSVAYTSPNSTGTLVFNPSTSLTGTCQITVTVNNGGKSNNVIARTFSVTVITPPNPLAPKFTQALTGSAVTVGQSINLTVGVSGKAPFKYQWQFNGANLASATGATLTLKNFKASQAGSYSVTVSNGYGSTNSGAAFVSIKAAAPALSTRTQLMVAPATAPAAPATLTSARQANGQFAFLVTGTAGSNYVVQASSDLKNWSAVATNTSPFTFSDPNASSFSQRFYRAYSQP